MCSGTGAPEVLELLAGRIVPRGNLVRAWALRGGVSAQVTAMEVADPWGKIRKLVLRRHGPRDLAANPRVAAHEHRLLEILARAGIPAPRPVFLDEACDLLPTPWLAVEFIEGEPLLPPAPDDLDGRVARMAGLLAEIHQVDTAEMGFLRRAVPPVYAASMVRANAPTLLHGDFWPGNTLWRGGILAGIIDWEDARLGDPLADVANARLELRWAFGAGAMAAFTEHYRRVAPGLGFEELPRWDLAAAARLGPGVSGWGLDDDRKSKVLRELESFRAEAEAATRAMAGAEARATVHSGIGTTRKPGRGEGSE